MAIENSEVLIKFKGDTTGVQEAEKEVDKSLETIKKIGEVASATLVTKFNEALVEIAKTGITYNAQIETYLTRLETLTGSTEEANKILEQIKKDALATPFEVSSLTQAESLLLATGLSAEQSRADILALGDAIAASGGGNDELQRMAVNLQQIKNVGKATSLDIKQFAYAGIDIYGLLADSMGITREEASKMTVTYDILSKALQKASQKGGKYYNAMAKQSKTYNGAMSNLTESIDVFKGAISEGLFDALKSLIPALTDMFDWLTKNKDIVMAIIIPIMTFIEILGGFLVLKVISGLFLKFFAILLANPIGIIVASIGGLIAIFINLWNNCEEFRNFFINLWETLKNAVSTGVQAIISFIASLPQHLMNLINNIVNFFATLPERIGYFIGLLVGTLTKFIIVDLPNFINSVINWFAQLPGNIWNFFNQVINKLVLFATGMINAAAREIPKIINSIINFFKELPKRMINIGVDMIKGLWNGIVSMKDWIGKKIKGFGDGIVNGFKKVFNIHSPSRVMEDKIGVNLGLGVVEGIDETENDINKSINNISKGIATTIDFGNLGLNQSNLTSALNYNSQPIVNVYNNMELDTLGQVVSNIKTFSGGAKNDYNYGAGA